MHSSVRNLNYFDFRARCYGGNRLNFKLYLCLTLLIKKILLNIMDEEIEEIVENEEFEPVVTSEDPEERKLARRLRIQRRIEAIRRQREADGSEIPVEVEKSLLDKQTETSALVLEKLLIEGDEVVTNIQIGNENREINRRAREQQRRAEILDKLQDESQNADERYEEISRKWDVISKYKDPLDISDNISLQRELCDELIKQKDEIIALLKEEINQAELKYVNDQETQTDDITILCRRIDNQVDLMRRAYRHELQLIEETIATERQILVDTNNKKWDNLYKQRNIDEESNMLKKINMADEFLQVFYNTRVDHEEKFRATKISLENEIEALEKELEQLKAACLLNGEKLDYNYNILKKREDENLIIRSQQKRLINHLQDDINKVKRNMKDYKNKSDEQINKLIHEITKMRNSIFQVEEKADHICSVNDRKFHEVWELNEEKATSLLNKIKTTDRIIHEQLLGTEWKPSARVFVKKNNLPSYKEAMEILEENKNVPTDYKMKPSNLIIEGTNIPPSLLKSILEKIAFRSGFLLEKTLHTILPELSDDNKKIIRADNVFNAIGITKQEHLKIVSDLFLPFARCPICEKAETLVSEDSMIKPSSQTMKSTIKVLSGKDILRPEVRSMIDPIDPDFLKCMTESTVVMADIVASEMEDVSDKTFVEEESTSSTVSLTEVFSSEHDTKSVIGAKKELRVCSQNHPIYIENAGVYKILRQFVKLGLENQEAIMTLENRLARKRYSLSRLLSEEDIKTYWSQFSSYFSATNEELWNGLLFGLKRYYAILEDRQKVYKEVVALRKENFELRHMLKYCNFEKRRKSPSKKTVDKQTSIGRRNV